MDVFSILADPHRRRIIDMLAERERSVNELVAAFSVSQPAISRHLRVLRDAGMVVVRGEAQQRIYRLQPEPLSAVDAWLARYRDFWNDRLDALEHLAEQGSAAGDPSQGDAP
jgi:DNA-binding transcriptional ArsR family regulator